MIAWIDGIRGVSPPEWAIDLIYAEKWGLAPWELEEAPDIWVERQNLLDRLRQFAKR